MPLTDLSPEQVYYEKYPALKPEGTIVFIHGSGGAGDVWREQVRELSGYWDCIRIDLPGHGRSRGPAFSSVAKAASFLKLFNAGRELLPPLYLVGHSLGAAITLHYARYFSAGLGGFILLGGGAKMKVLPQVLESLAQGRINDEFARIAFSSQADPALVEEEIKKYRQNSPAALYSDLKACHEFDLTDQLAAIITPALLIVGQDDMLTPVKYAQFLKTHLPDAALHVIKAAGHFAMLENPEAVNRAIIEFIRAKT